MKIDVLKLEKCMARRTFTYHLLSEKSGVSEVTISRLKKKSQNPKPSTLGKLAKALGVDVTEIIADE